MKDDISKFINDDIKHDVTSSVVHNLIQTDHKYNERYNQYGCLRDVNFDKTIAINMDILKKNNAVQHGGNISNGANKYRSKYMKYVQKRMKNIK